MQRRLLVRKNQSQVFHVISRVVDKRFIFGEKEKGVFLGMMRKMEAFCGVEIMSYCIMDNHFHILLHVPARPEAISKEVIRERMRLIYDSKKMNRIDAEINEKKSLGQKDFEENFYEKQRVRMYDLSNFVREIKLRFSKWYNASNERSGTLWEERFKSLVVEGEEGAMSRIAAYIELNPVRAGIVDQPHEYRWCSYTEAVAGGSKARKGIMKLSSGLAGPLNWEEASGRYRSYFLYKSMAQSERKKGLSRDQFEAIVSKNKGKLSNSEIWKTKMRYFTDGVVIGSKDFITRFIGQKEEGFGRDRKKACYRIGKEDEVFSFRKVG